MSDDDFNEVWNRACGFDSPALRTHPGDEALHVALVFHGSVMNGGLLDAVQSYRDDEEYPLPRVQQAHTYLGLDATAQVIDHARREVLELADSDLEAAEGRIDATYTLEDDSLERAARSSIDNTPGAFAPP